MQELLNPMSPMSPMVDAYNGRYQNTLTHTPSMDRRGASPSVIQQRVAAERKWVLGIQVCLNSCLDLPYVDGPYLHGMNTLVLK